MYVADLVFGYDAVLHRAVWFELKPSPWQYAETTIGEYFFSVHLQRYSLVGVAYRYVGDLDVVVVDKNVYHTGDPLINIGLVCVVKVLLRCHSPGPNN